MMQIIARDYFDGGLKDYKREDYKFVGLLMGLSILQNGKIPRFMEEDMLKNVFGQRSDMRCVKDIQDGLSEVGVYQVAHAFPILLHIFRKNENNQLTIKQLTRLLKPSFSEIGSNKRALENEVYGKFLKYMRESASGRRGSISLGHILKFTTGTDEEPLLDYELEPSLIFDEVVEKGKFIPTARTCINQIRLPRPSLGIPLIPDENLYTLYDYAFANCYFGTV